MPPDDWLCQKLERLNLTVAEGYPSRSQDSAGLRRDQFIKVPKSQEKWYKMHLLKSDGPHRPGRSVFNWRNTEAKVNSHFPRITRASAYPSTGPPSRPIAQESLRRWERAAREDSYIINHAAGFSRCSTELQEKMSQNITLLSSRLGKGKCSKDVSNALNDLRDLMASSLMQPSCPQIRIFKSLKPVALLRDPDRVLLSTQIGKVLKGTNLTTLR